MRRVVCLAVSLAAIPALGQGTANTREPVVQIPWAAPQDGVQANRYGQRSRIFDEPPTFTLTPASAEAHAGKVWVRAAEDGLLVFVDVDTPDDGARWPRQKSEVLGSDHVELWLAAATHVDMPPIGWGNQFGEETLKTPQDCATDPPSTDPAYNAAKLADCERWYGEQQAYRENLRRLFVRQWLGFEQPGQQGKVFEAFASEAWWNLTRSVFEPPKPLEPRAEDGVTLAWVSDKVRQGTRQINGTDRAYGWRTGYRFQFFIPYGAFPPIQQTDLKDLYLGLDVYSAAPDGKKMGAVSSTAPGHAWGRPETFNHVQLAKPQHYAMGACDVRPSMTDMYGNDHRAWFYPVDPTKSDVVDSVFALINPAGGYMYDADGVSPEAQTTRYFWQKLPDGAVVCGPQLAYRKASVTAQIKDVIQEKYLDARILPDGWMLVRNGPVLGTRSPFGSGQCGACPEVGFDIYAISPAGKITPALGIDQDLSGEPGVPDQADLSISADWSRVTLFRNVSDDPSDKPSGEPAAEKWEAVDYCLEEKPVAAENVPGAAQHAPQTSHTYKECGTRNNVKPPTPPHYPEMRDPNSND